MRMNTTSKPSRASWCRQAANRGGPWKRISDQTRKRPSRFAHCGSEPVAWRALGSRRKQQPAACELAGRGPHGPDGAIGCAPQRVALASSSTSDPRGFEEGAMVEQTVQPVHVAPGGGDTVFFVGDTYTTLLSGAQTGG